MASTSGCSRQLKQLKLSDTCCTMGGSDELDSLTASASEADHATSSSSLLSALGECIPMEREKSGECTTSFGVEETTASLSSPFFSAVEEQIKHSKSHWSVLADQSGCIEVGEEVAEVSNVEEFKALQRNPTWGGFFATFGGDFGIRRSKGELVVGKKFAEGGQAELYDAQVKWWYSEGNEEDVNYGTKYVLKVFKKGTFLKHLKSQLPHRLLQHYAHRHKNWKSLTPKVIPRYISHVYHGTLLKDGRFAFLMKKEPIDLGDQIEHNMKLRSVEDCGPFSKDEAESIMYDVALGVNWLHNCDIVHRNLKASNVLVNDLGRYYYPKWNCHVATINVPIGVVGMGFFRAPEILQVYKDRKSSQRPEVFSRAGDVYGYGMTCYEILRGKLRFEDHPLSENCPLLIDLVINHYLRLEILEYVVDWTSELLSRYWQAHPTTRPSFEEIFNLLLVNLAVVRKDEKHLKRKYG